jgi:hypothetical protein
VLTKLQQYITPEEPTADAVDSVGDFSDLLDPTLKSLLTSAEALNSRGKFVKPCNVDADKCVSKISKQNICLNFFVTNFNTYHLDL